MNLGGKIRKLDIYKKVPVDLSEGTNIGGLVSIITFCLISFFMYKELSSFLNTSHTASIQKDEFFTRDEMRIHIDMTFPSFPCEVISLDLQDIMLSHHPNIGSIKKWRLDSDGKYLDRSDFQLLRQPNINKQYEMAKSAFQKKYGCRLKGSFTVKQVPGNFHISSHAYQNIFIRLSMQGILENLNVSHTVHDLHFGEQSDITFISERHPEAVLTPLNQAEVISSSTEFGSYIHHYHIDIVPTLYHQNFLSKIKAFQYTANHNSFKIQHMPVIYFNYHIGGLAVYVYREGSNLLQFVINLCAIIGGTYTIASFLEMLLNRIFTNGKNRYELVN